MKDNYLTEAFKSLQILNEEEFNLNDSEDVEKIKDFADVDDESEFVEIIDDQATSEEELADSYVGKVICDCSVCHSKVYKAPTDIVIDDETQLANVGEECPYCYSMDGYKIVGQVAPFEEKEEEPVEEPKEGEELGESKLDEAPEGGKYQPKHAAPEGPEYKPRHASKAGIAGEAGLASNKNPDYRPRHAYKPKHAKKELGEALLKEKPDYDLRPEYDSRKSFYNKARVNINDENGVKTLYSYNTPVCKIENGKVTLLPRWNESQTTLRHVKEFLKQNGFNAGSKSDLAKEYANESLEESKEDLPEMCYVDTITDGIGIVKKGESGYYRTDLAQSNNVKGKAVGELVDMLNDRLGVTKAQAEAMKIGSMFGWDVPGADPNDDSANTDKFESVETKQFGQLKEDVGDIDVDTLVNKFNKEYDFLYEHNDNVAGYAEARDYFDDVLLPASKDESKLAFKLLRAFSQKRQDIISSDREAAAFVFALDSLGYLDRIEMGESLKVENTTPSQQLKESSHSDEYSYKIGNNTYKFVCTSLGTRDGFAHRVKLFLNDNILSSARCDYLNRTWETFTYQSCMRKAITKAINNNSADKKDLALLKDEIDNSISAGDREIKAKTEEPLQTEPKEDKLDFVDNRRNAVLGKGDDPGFDEYDESLKESVVVDMNNKTVTSDSGEAEIDMNSGKVELEAEGEEITPLKPEMKNEIEANSDVSKLEDEPEEIDYEVNDFDEGSFDELGEGYLKKVYENVDSFKTTKVSKNKNTLTLEGLIKFNSGKEKKTSFVFEAKDASKNGKVKFLGENCQISRGKKSFTLKGSVSNKAFIAESLTYNYMTKDNNNKSVRLYGTIKKTK